MRRLATGHEPRCVRTKVKRSLDRCETSLRSRLRMVSGQTPASWAIWVGGMPASSALWTSERSAGLRNQDRRSRCSVSSRRAATLLCRGGARCVGAGRRDKRVAG